jgi:hypothetical protein
MTASAAIDHQSATPAPLDVLRARAEARATLVANGYLDLQIAVDELQESAAAQGLLKEFGGQDRVQEILAQSFARYGNG